MTTFIGSLKERETNQGKRRRERPAPHSEISLCQGYHNAIKKSHFVLPTTSLCDCAV